MSIEQQQGTPIIGQSLENLIRPYVGYLTFGIDIAAGIIIGISAIFALIAFLSILRKPIKEQQQIKKPLDFVWLEVCYLLWILKSEVIS